MPVSAIDWIRIFYKKTFQNESMYPSSGYDHPPFRSVEHSRNEGMDLIPSENFLFVQWLPFENGQSPFYVVNEVTLTKQKASLKFC